MQERESLVAAFAGFADQARDYSPVYDRLATAVAADPDILDLAAHAHRLPVPNLLFASVHYLLLAGESHPLAEFYPTLGGDRTGDPYPAFVDFCRSHRDRIIELLGSRFVQTNEVGRSAVLLPALAPLAGSRPLALVEIGCSAGLNLRFDRFSYDYGPAGSTGPTDSPVHLVCRARRGRPSIPAEMPQIAARIGIDLNPLDVSDPDDVAWMRALLWPEHLDRVARLLEAVEVARSLPVDLRRGDGLALLPQALDELPDQARPVVFHTLVLNQWSLEQRRALAELLQGYPDVTRVSMEWIGTPECQVRLGGIAPHGTLLARCHPHGHWLEWEAQPSPN